MTTSAPPSAAVATHDTRRFWRVLLAVVLPIPWLAKGVQYAVQPSFDNFADQVAYLETHGAYSALQWLDTAFVVLVVPSVLALAWLARRGAPRLSTVAAILMGGGILAGVARVTNGDLLAWVAAREGYDAKLIDSLGDDLEASPTAGLGGLLFIVGLVVGSIVLGFALWRSRVVPRWAAVAVGFGGASHPFLQFSHVVVGIGLAVLAAGCAAASAAYLRMPDDELDLPPIKHASH